MSKSYIAVESEERLREIISYLDENKEKKTAWGSGADLSYDFEIRLCVSRFNKVEQFGMDIEVSDGGYRWLFYGDADWYITNGYEMKKLEKIEELEAFTNKETE